MGDEQVGASVESIDTTAAEGADDWEIEEIVARFDRVSESQPTRSGGSTGCH